MTPDSAAAPYAHLPEVPLQIETLCPLLLELYWLARDAGRPVTLRHQYVGGNPDGITLFCTHFADGGAIPVMWSRAEAEWVPAFIDSRPGTVGSVTRREPLDMTTKRRRPAIWRLFVDLIRDLRGAP